MKKIFLILLFLPLIVSAHGLVTTQVKQVGQYGIEFEYNTIGNIAAGDYTLFDVYLVNPEDLSGMDYDSSFVRIGKKDGVAAFAANLATSKDLKGYAGFSATINEPGQYVAATTFYKDGQQITQADFDFTVDPGLTVTSNTTGKKSIPTPVIIFGGLGVLIIGFLFGRSKKT